MTYDWYEVWASDAMDIPYVLLLLHDPGRPDCMVVVDPKEGDSDRGNALRRHKGSHPPGVSLLTTSALPRRRRGWLPLDADRVGRRRPGAVGGVLVETCSQILDLPFRLRDVTVQAGDAGPGLVREAVPDVLRDQSRPFHSAVIIRRPRAGNPVRE